MRRKPGPAPGTLLKPWPQEKIDELRAMAQTHSTANIAKHFGLTLGQCQYRYRLYKIAKRHVGDFTVEERNRILDILAKHGYDEAEKILGKPRKTLQSYKCKYKKLFLSKTADPVKVMEVAKKAKIHAYKMRQYQLADEFVSFAMNEYLTKRRYKMNWLWPDFRRERDGRVGTKRGSRREVDFEDASVKQAVANETPDTSDYVSALIEEAKLKRLHRISMLLRYKEGWHSKKIAELFGVSEPMISQINALAVKQLRAVAAEKEESYE